MLIKRVMIQGFKTFAKRTEFIFDPGVTAIVGPNGSGKSNVVDAIRWCLGEQSFSLLRSKKTSDVIFSGSDNKARLGMAQVSLFLDNSQGELPVDFEEIEISRRAYRDGDNEYLLNGRRVRLQDITELLAQTGLGKRTYALIGQGLIDRILSLAPEELRGLFEEAAGITGYQAKRATTLRRLDATQDNLTRVQDIVAEISPRLSYLKRQAARARERAQIASDLHNLLLDWYGYHWHQTLSDLTTKHKSVDDLKAQTEKTQAELNEISAQIAALRQQQATVREQVGGLHHQSSDLHRQAEALSKELAVAQERMRQIQARRETSQQELAPLRLQAETIEARLRETSAEISAWTETQRARQAAVDELQQLLDARQQDRNRLMQDVAATRSRLHALQTQAAELKSRGQQNEARRAEIARETAIQMEARDKAASADAQQTDVVAALEAERASCAQEMESLRNTLQEISAQIEDQREALDVAQTRRQQADRETDRLQTRHELLARLHREGAGFASGVRAVIQAADGNTDRRASSPAPLRGILGAVASLIKVPAHLDKAIETALGGAMQNIVTQTWADTQAAIEWLKTHRHGRATFLPLDRLHTLPAIPAPTHPGMLGNARDLVDCDPGVTQAIEQLLNRVWVAEDLPAARAALDQIRSGPRPTVVTLAGEIVRPGGAVTGGSDREQRDDSILARERELRNLPAQINEAEATGAQLAQTCRQIAVEIEQAATRQQPIQAQLDDLTHQEAALRTRLEEARRAVDRSRQTAQWHEQRRAELAAEADTLGAQRHALSQQLAEVEQEITTVETLLAQAESKSEQSAADDLHQQMAELRAIAAEAKTTLQNKKALLDTQHRNLETLQTQIQAKTQQIETLAQESQHLEAQIQTLNQREDALNRAIAEMQVKLNPAEAQLEAWEAEQAAREQQERAHQETLRRVESSYNTAQLQYQRADDRLDQLRRNIEQDLGLVMLETVDDLAYQPPLPWEAIVEKLPVVEELADHVEADVREMRARLSRLSNVNPDAPREYAEAAGRHEHLLSQSQDLEAAIADLRKVIRELDDVMERELTKTFAAVSEQFVHFFQQLFNGGSARLVLAEPDDITNSGIEIIARPPGKRPQSLALLSGGERTLTACALIFAILRVSPTPFCVLDEVDAALDEANVDRFRHTLTELSRDTQFIVITHNRRTLEGTNAIYGVTLASDGTSRVISLRLEGDRIVRAQGASDKAQDDGGGQNVGNTDEDAKQLGEIEELVKM